MSIQSVFVYANELTAQIDNLIAMLAASGRGRFKAALVLRFAELIYCIYCN